MEGVSGDGIDDRMSVTDTEGGMGRGWKECELVILCIEDGFLQATSFLTHNHSFS